MRKIQPEGFAEPKGHYSPAVVHNGLIFVSGQLAVDPHTGEEMTGSIEEQTERCLKNVEAVLKAAESSLDRVLKMTLFVADENLWGRVNDTYKTFMGDHRPARAIIPVGHFRGNFLIEVEAIAALSE